MWAPPVRARVPAGQEVAPARVRGVLPAGAAGGGAELRPGHHRLRVRLHLGAEAALAQVGDTVIAGY